MIRSAFKLLFLIAVCLFFIFVVATCTVENARADIPSKGDPAPVVKDHCIDHREWLAGTRTDRTRMEKSMGVYKDGKIVSSQHKGRHIIVQYKWCGHSLDDGYYEIAYSLSERTGYHMSSYFSEWRFGQYAKRVV